MITKAKAKAAKYPEIRDIIISPKPDKKLRAILNDGTHIDFGSRSSQTYLEGASEMKRKAYQARHSKIKLKDGSLAYQKKFSPSWFSWHVLWT